MSGKRVRVVKVFDYWLRFGFYFCLFVFRCITACGRNNEKVRICDNNATKVIGVLLPWSIVRQMDKCALLLLLLLVWSLKIMKIIRRCNKIYRLMILQIWVGGFSWTIIWNARRRWKVVERIFLNSEMKFDKKNCEKKIPENLPYVLTLKLRNWFLAIFFIKFQNWNLRKFYLKKFIQEYLKRKKEFHPFWTMISLTFNASH